MSTKRSIFLPLSTFLIFARHFAKSPNTFAVARYDGSWTPGGILGTMKKSLVPKERSKYPTTIIELDAETTSEAGIQALVNSQTPFLLKDAVSNLSLEPILNILGHSVQNIFPMCEERAPTYLGESPTCTNITLRERVSELYEKANAGEKFGDAHVHLAPKSKMEPLVEAMRIQMGVRVKYLLDRIRTSAFQPITILFYSYGSQSSVSHYHMHMDSFFSMNLESKKVWKLIQPDFAPVTEPAWTGVSMAQTRPISDDNDHVPTITVHQEPGDILYVPSWYMHKTEFESNVISLGFSFHFIPFPTSLITHTKAPMFWKMSRVTFSSFRMLFNGWESNGRDDLFLWKN